MWTDSRIPNASGALARAFAPVGDAFADNFEEGQELGASFAVMIGGELVVDIRGGFTDRAQTTPWSDNSIACVYSTGKAVLTMLMAREVGAGRLDYDRPVADYWPEFAQHGKGEITVAQILSHQGGLCGLAEEMPPATWLDWNAITDKLASMAPLWAPGSANGYHPQTFGYLAGELLRRVSGRTVGAILKEDFAGPHALNLYCGMGEDEIARAAFMPKPPRAPDLGELNEFTKLAFLKPWSATSRVAREDWMAAEIPASNMHGDARGFATVIHPMANGGRAHDGAEVLSRDAIDQALTERIRGDDLVLPFHLSWCAGLMRNINRHFGPNENAFGHAGFGGSAILIDLENNLTAAYVMNKMSPHLVGDPRFIRLTDALYACL